MNTNQTKQLFVRKPESGSLSQQKNQTLSPLKKYQKFCRKPQTSTNLPFYVKSPIRVKNQQTGTAKQKKPQIDTNSQENMKEKNEDIKNKKVQQNFSNNSNVVQQKEEVKRKQEDQTIFAYLKTEQEWQNQTFYPHQSLSSGNTSDQYSLIYEEDEFLTSFNQKFFNRQKDDFNNQKDDGKLVKTQKYESFSREKLNNRYQKQKQKNDYMNKNSNLYQIFDVKKYKSQSRKKIQQEEKLKEISKQQIKENSKQQEKEDRQQKLNEITSQIGGINLNMLKSSYPKFSNLSSITENKQHVFQSFSYQVSVQSQNHQQPSAQINLSYSMSNNQPSLFKVNKSSKLMKIQQQPSEEQDSTILVTNNQQQQQQQITQQKKQDKSKVQENINHQRITQLILSKQKTNQTQNKNNLIQDQKIIDIIEPCLKNKLLDSFGIGVSQASKYDSKLNIFLQQNQIQKKMQISEVKGDLVQQMKFIQQSNSLQSHYNRDKYQSYYQNQDCYYSHQHQYQYQPQQESLPDNDSQIETSESTYTITEPDTSIYKQDKYQGQYENERNQHGGHANFYYNSYHQGYQSSSQSEQRFNRFNQNSNNKKVKQQVNSENKYYNKKYDGQKTQRKNNNNQLKQNQSIQQRYNAVYKKSDQFYHLHMNKLDGLVLQILQMKKDFQKNYLNTIRAQTQQNQNTNAIILRQLRDIQNKLINNKQKLDNQTQKRSKSRAKQLIKYSSKRQSQNQYQSSQQIQQQEDYSHLQSSIVNVIKPGCNNLQSSIVNAIKPGCNNLLNQNYHKSKNNTFHNTSINNNINSKLLENKLQNKKNQIKNKSSKAQTEKQNKSRQNNLLISLPPPKKQSVKQHNIILQESNETSSLNQLNSLNSSCTKLQKQIKSQLIENKKNTFFEKNLLKSQQPLKFSHKQKRSRKNNQTKKQFSQTQKIHKSKQQEQSIQRNNVKIQQQDCQNEKKINQSIQCEWQTSNQGTISENTSVYSSNKSIDIQAGSKIMMLNSLPYISKVVSNKKQLKKALKIIKKAHKSLLNPQKDEKINKKEQIQQEQIKSNLNNELNQTQKGKQCHKQSRIQREQIQKTNKEQSEIKCVQTVHFDDYEIYNNDKNKQNHYLTDGFLTQFQRQTIEKDDQQYQRQVTQDQSISINRTNISSDLVNGKSQIMQKQVQNNQRIQQQHLSSRHNTEINVSQQSSSQIRYLKESNCFIIQSQTINIQSQTQTKNYIHMSLPINQNPKLLQSNQLKHSKQLNHSTVNQKPDENPIRKNKNKSSNSTNFIKNQLTKSINQHSKQSINTISFNKKLKQGHYAQGQTKKVNSKYQNIKDKINQNHMIDPNYSDKFNNESTQQSNLNSNNSPIEILPDSPIEILPDSPMHQSIYYQRYDKEMYKYKWFKFK